MAFVPFTKEDQPTMAAFNEKFQQAIDQAIVGGVKIEVGSYVGTGTKGSANPNSLTFGFEPKGLILSTLTNADYVTIAYRGQTTVNTKSSSNAYFTWAGNVVSWYNDTNTDYQLNTSGITYNYIAIG